MLELLVESVNVKTLTMVLAAIAAGATVLTLAMPLIAVWSYLLDGVFIGATAIREMRNSIFLALAIYLPAWWLTQQAAAPDYVNHALWLSFLIFTAARSLVLASYYWHHRRSRWCHQANDDTAQRIPDRPV